MQGPADRRQPTLTDWLHRLSLLHGSGVPATRAFQGTMASDKDKPVEEVPAEDVEDEE